MLDDLLYTTDRNFGFRIFDIKNCTDIVQIGGLGIGASYGFVITREEENILVYVSTWESGLKILNITEPENVQLLGEYNDGGDAYNVAVKDDLVFVAEFHDGLEILQIKTPNNGVSPRKSSIIPGFELYTLLLGFSQLALCVIINRINRAREN